MKEIEKPKQRSQLRQILGKEYFILKRKMNWLFGNRKWAVSKSTDPFTNTVFRHKSMILRPLKNLDMYLQENKRTNLKIAVSHINQDRKSTRLNSSHVRISYAVFCLKKKKKKKKK